MGSDPSATGASWPRDARALAATIHKALVGADPSSIRWIVSSANGPGALDCLEAAALREVFGSLCPAPVLAPKPFIGEFDGSGLLRLVAALSGLPSAIHGLGMMLGASAGGGCAALLLNVP
jgi:3-oxoacyl-(acyl-carrier-protein) synthase